MIIVRLCGGLGNQMFQYAIGRNLAYVYNTTLKLDVSAYSNDSLRVYELNIFNISEEFATEQETALYESRRIKRVLLQIKNVFKPNKIRYIKELDFTFAKEILNCGDDVYLDGYWQSPKYFKNIEKIIRKDFILKKPLNGRNIEIGERIKKNNAISIHIRRGDYVSNRHTNEYHGVCELDYYYRCIVEIIGKVKKPVFYVFSDDIDWVAKNLKLSYPFELVNHNGTKTAYEDMRLMSMCKHNIIANSSFSWWGAWLNPNPDKLVYVPKKWFGTYQADTSDLIPDGWIRV